ncbi:MAG: hypothetical protein GYA15_14525 [Leptolinea sp.]|jgi:hypothetical protein|nr:hypothetical protein [Leptolinea sp.]
MKLSFWDILSTILLLAGLAITVIFINIFVNPYSFVNPFPPTKAVTATPDLSATARKTMPELWTTTPAVPTITGVNPSQTIFPTITRVILPTRYLTSTRTPNWLATFYALRTPTRTHTATGDITPPTNPGTPVTSSPTTDATPTWTWSASSDAGSGMNYYQVAWGLDINCGNPVYASGSNVWTSPQITSNAIYYICLRAIDRAGNASAWVGPSGFFYSGPVGPATLTSTSTRTPTFTSTNPIPPTVTSTFTSTPTSTNTLAPTVTNTGFLTYTSTSTATTTNTTAPVPTETATSTATDTLMPPATFTSTSTDTATLPATATSTDTLAPTLTFTATDTLAPTPTFTETETPAPTQTFTITMTPTETPTVTVMPGTFTITGNTGVGPTATPSGDPVPAVTISVTGDPGAVVTQPDGLGNYSVTVPANWSGEITPSRLGYVFTPVKYTYTNVSGNIPDQNFTSAVAAATFTISGNVGAVPGATITADNGAVVTLQPELDGNYNVVVYIGWSGSIKATHATCTYTPPQYDYINVGADLPGQDFAPTCP